MKKIGIVFGLLLVMGVSLAIQPAEDWDSGGTSKYISVANANYTTEGGNVTNLNLTGNVSTEKWAGYWGNVSGNIVLSPGTAMFYTWNWDSSYGGEVCAIAAPSEFDWSAVQNIGAAVIDTAWGFFAGDVDSAASTFADASCNVNVAGVAVAPSTGVTTNGGTFETCAVGDGGANKSDVAFCVNITQGGTLFNTLTGDYQLLAATNESVGGFETHYFWLELG